MSDVIVPGSRPYELHYEFYGENDEASKDGLDYEFSAFFTCDHDAIEYTLSEDAFDKVEFDTGFLPIEGTVTVTDLRDGGDFEIKLDLNGDVLECKVGE